MRRKPIRHVIRTGLLVVIWAGLALAVGSQPNTAEVERADLKAVRPAGSGLKAEIAAIFTERDAAVAELRAEFAAAPSDEEALRIQRRIEAAHYRAETALLEAQIPYALKRGDTSARSLRAYDSIWASGAGKNNGLYHRVGQVFYNLEDRKMERLLVNMSREEGLIDRTGVDAKKLVRVLWKTSPLLLMRSAVRLWAG